MRPLSVFAAALLTLLLAAPTAAADTGQDLIRRLKQGLGAKEPVARQRIALDVGRFSGHLDDKQKKRAAALLNKAFTREQHIETRRVFVRAMARLRHQSAWIPVLNAALGEGDDPVRATARLEVFRGGVDLLEVAFKLIDQETSASYRAQLVLLLGDRRRRDAVPRLLPLLRDKQGIVVAAVSVVFAGQRAAVGFAGPIPHRIIRHVQLVVGNAVAGPDEENLVVDAFGNLGVAVRVAAESDISLHFLAQHQRREVAAGRLGPDIAEMADV